MTKDYACFYCFTSAFAIKYFDVEIEAKK